MLKVKPIFKIISIVLCTTLLLLLGACTKPTKKYNMVFSKSLKTSDIQFNGSDDTQNLILSQETVDILKNNIESICVIFPFSEFFETEECYKRLQNPTAVGEHDSTFKSFDDLTLNALVSRVIENNNSYLQNNTFGYEVPQDDDIQEFCELIIKTIYKLKEQINSIDCERVLCNLSNLKILYKKGMVDNAQVTVDMVLNISPNMFKIVDLMSGENGCRNVVIHEIMHIVQLGCKCENIEHSTMRCGFSYRWDDFDINSTDFRWLFEGSAERMMCNLTGDDALTYKYMINYICTMNLSTMLNDDVPANYLETLSFYNDINKLYELFKCETKAEKLEILNMLIATNIIQMAPEEFLSVYADTNQEDTNDNATIDKINYTLKPAVCLVMTKCFYEQLLSTISAENPITINDLLFVINLFEASLDNHLKYTNQDLEQYNQVFIDKYLSIRTPFLKSLSEQNGIDLVGAYKVYEMMLNEKTINASLEWLAKDKKDFFIERVECLEFNRKSKIHN